MMRFLTISILFVFLFSSCAVHTVRELTEIKTSNSSFSNPYFSNMDTDYVYKAKISAYKHVFGGILIIKKIKENNHRIVFTTNFGNKIFDFELDNGSIQTHFILKELDRGIIVKTLKRDFKSLTQEHNSVSKTFESNQDIVYQSKSENRFNHFIVTKKIEELTTIIHSTKSKEKIIISFNNNKNNIAHSIYIEHRNAPIKINLDYLNNY